MNDWKVFEVDGMDLVCARSEEEARKFYEEEVMLDPVQDCDEVNIEKEYMWLGFDLDRVESRKDLIDLLNDHKDKVYEMKSDDIQQEFDLIVKLTLKEVIEVEKPTEPYIIGSIEY